MTNKERYQKTFSAFHTSCDFSKERETMKQKKTIRISRLAAVCAALAIILGLATAAYAADLGGVQRSIQIWIRGDQTDAVLEIENGNYSLTYEDAAGNVHQKSGGGVAVGPDGRVRPATEDEILRELSMPDVVYEEDGTAWVYYFDQKIEITDRFDEQGVCYVQLKNGEDVFYMTIKDHGGYATGKHKYPNPKSFN
ncbi:MAG: hypothetical protein II028_02365 [Clostridia bacterium]|nr:hypothetical protein [Clostridia bacterium]MBQ2324452.1 hypothetical protein [Oscillospiraceae bacterium]